MASVPNRWTASAAAEIGSNNNEKAAHVPQPTHLHRNGGANDNIDDLRSKQYHIILTMASMSWALFAILVVVAIATAEDMEERDHILVLNSKNFDKATKEFTQLLVEWYSPSCGHCKALEPGE